MSNLDQFIGGTGVPKTIVNNYSGGGKNNLSDPRQKEILSGSLTATVLKTLLTISGAGAFNLISAISKDATPRTVHLKVTLDGVEVFNAISSAFAAANYGIDAVVAGYTVSFNTSAVIEVASSLSETDKVALAVIYETR